MASVRSIAKEAGFSRTTVSYVLSGKAAEHHISQDTCRKVQQVAERLNYQPNYHFQAISTGRARAVGLPMTKYLLHNRYWDLISRGVAEALSDSGNDLVIMAQPRREGMHERVLKYLRGKRVDGVVLLGHTQVAELLEKSNPAAKAVTIQMQPSCFPCIRLDPERAIHEAVAHLAELGHRHIAYIGLRLPPAYKYSESEGILCKDRREIVRTACRDQGLELKEHILPCLGQPMHFEAYMLQYYTLLNEILPLLANASAVFCYEDMLAIALLMLLREQAVAVPGDLSVVGFDDLYALESVPPLTTIDHCLFEMGRRAAEVLIQEIEGTWQGGDAIVEAKFVMRQSTGQART